MDPLVRRAQRGAVFRLLLQVSVLSWVLSGWSNCDAAETTTGVGRPRIGLALSGGGSRAGAHIGVLRALESQRIPVDYIAGTSAGAIIGSLYASGMHPDEVERAVAGIDWVEILDDQPSRRDLPYRRKLDSFNYLVKYRPGFKGGDIAIPTGLIEGQDVVSFLRRQYGDAAAVTDFDSLPIPIRVVATDLETGEAVVIREGDLARAVRASMSIPLLFTPIDYDGRILIDGGPANNLPVDVVRRMGADIVIAVDITSPLMRSDELDSALAVADQLTNMLTQRNVQAQRRGLTEADVLIVPDVGKLGGLDFEGTLDSVEPGFRSAMAVASDLARYAVTEDAYRAHVAARRLVEPLAERTISTVIVNNSSGVSDTLIARRFAITPGETLDRDELDAGVDRVYGLDLFRSVDYRLVPDADAVAIELDVDERPWGPDYLQFGMVLSEDFSIGSDFNIGMAYLRTAVNDRGGEWRAQLDLGELQGLRFNWYQPISLEARHFFEVDTQISRRSFQFFEDGELTAGLRVEGWGTRLSIGTEFGTTAELRAGWNHFDGDAETTIGVIDVPDRSVDIGEYFASFRYDTLDNIDFPRSGGAGGVGAFWSLESAGGKSEFEQVTAAAYQAYSRGESTVLFSAEAGTTLDSDAPLESQFLLGGFGRLSGYARNRFAGQHYAFGSLTAYRRMKRSLWVPTYAGVSVEAGNVWDDRDAIDGASLLFAGSAFVGVDTVLGPLYFAWGLSEGGEDTVYLILGNPFVSSGARALD